MEALALPMAADDRRRAVDGLLPLSGPAYQLAVHILKSPDGAEDAVQQAYLSALEHLPDNLGLEDARTWFLRVVANAAKKQARSDLRRRRRESEVRKNAPSGPDSREDMIATLRRELWALHEGHRLPIALCYEQNLTQRQAAAVLEMPAATLSRRVNEGLELLRRRLAQAGYAAAPAAVAAALAHTAPAAPVSLEAGLRALAAKWAAGVVPAASVAPLAAKGGLIVKLVLGIAAAGLAGASAFWAVGGRPDEPAKSQKRFATPVTDPTAEWEYRGLWGGRGYGGPHALLDGPHAEAMSYTSPVPRVFSEDGAEWVFRTYDKRTERYLTLAGCGAPGDFNGPFSRARIGGWGYVGISMSGNKRYVYMVGSDASRLKRLNHEKRIIENFAPDVTGQIPHWGNALRVVSAYDGGVVLLARRTIFNISDEGKLLSKCEVDYKDAASGIAYDAKRNRVIGTNRGSGSGGWMLWYWDLAAGGKFVGLIGNTPKEVLRKQGATGAFKGSHFWCPQGNVVFGPDDPDFRYVYIGGGDEGTTYRMDIEKRTWVKLGPSEGTDPRKNPVGMRLHWGDYPHMLFNGCRGGGFDEEGDIYGGYRNECFFWKRVK